METPQLLLRASHTKNNLRLDVCNLEEGMIIKCSSIEFAEGDLPFGFSCSEELLEFLREKNNYKLSEDRERIQLILSVRINKEK